MVPFFAPEKTWTQWDLSGLCAFASEAFAKGEKARRYRTGFYDVFTLCLHCVTLCDRHARLYTEV